MMDAKYEPIISDDAVGGIFIAGCFLGFLACIAFAWLFNQAFGWWGVAFVAIFGWAALWIWKTVFAAIDGRREPRRRAARDAAFQQKQKAEYEIEREEEEGKRKLISHLYAEEAACLKNSERLPPVELEEALRIIKRKFHKKRLEIEHGEQIAEIFAEWDELIDAIENLPLEKHHIIHDWLYREFTRRLEEARAFNSY